MAYHKHFILIIEQFLDIRKIIDAGKINTENDTYTQFQSVVMIYLGVEIISTSIPRATVKLNAYLKHIKVD